MSLVITQRPQTTILDQTSKWNASRNPIVYKAQRKDFLFDQINDNATFMQLQFTGVDLTASFSIDDSIYFLSDDSSHDFFRTVTAVAFSGGNTLVTVNSLFVNNPGPGFVNNLTLRPSYRVEVQVYGPDDNIGDVHIYSPTTKGYLLIDISEIVKAVVSPDNEAELTGTTEVFTDTGHFAAFAITTTEVWTGSAESAVDDGQSFNVIHGARQIPSPYGGSMAEYTVFDSLPGTSYGTVTHSRNSVGTSNGSAQAVTPDELDRIKIVITASATTQAASSVVAVVNLKLELNSVVVLTNQLGSFNIGASTSQSIGTLVRYLDSSDFGASGFDNYYIEIIVSSGAGTYSVQGSAIVYHDLILSKFLTKMERPVMWRGMPFLIGAIVQTDDSIYLDSSTSTTPDTYENEVIEFDLNQVLSEVDQQAEEIDIVLKLNGSGDPELSETLTIELRDACQNPVLLLGRDSLGGPLQWVFEVSQEEDFNYSNDIKRKRQVLSAAGLTKNQWDALQDFITLGEAFRENIVELLPSTNKTTKRIDQQLYVIDSEGNKLGVIAVPSRNRTQTKLHQHYFEIEIEYPDQF